MKLVVFDLEVAGHHPGYLHHLLRYWPAPSTHLVFVVSPELAIRHPAVVQTPTSAKVTWQPITQEELHWYETSKRSLVRRSWVEWQLYRRYTKKIQADQGLIMYLDRFQLPLALRLSLPCQTSGIFFRPRFHYSQYSERVPTRKERLHAQREQWLWRNALRHPQLKTLFCLDPLAIEPLRALEGQRAVAHLPDPLELYPHSPQAVTTLRQSLGLEPGRKVLLLFGMIDQRKGIYQVLEALQQLSIRQQKHVTLLLLGQIAQTERAKVLLEIDRLTQTLAVQIILHDQYIPEEMIQLYFEMADVALALYQRHVGSSGILVRAAAAGKPVLASDYGLMGELVRRHSLGLIVDSTQLTAIAKGIVALLAEDSASLINLQKATCFANENQALRFVQTIYEYVIQ